MEKEKFNLSWNDFEREISCAIRDLRNSEDFFDVTLACEDEQQIHAHKIIISACSPFFHKILQQNPHQHPLLYLKGMKYSDIQSVLHFMYHGEVSVGQEELESFLAVAEDLKIKGLSFTNSPAEETKPQIKPHHHLTPHEDSVSTPHNAATGTCHHSQQIIPVKCEPIDPLPTTAQPSPIVYINNQHHTHQSTEEAFGTSDDQSMTFQQENYEDYRQYEMEQEYEGNMEEYDGLFFCYILKV